MSTDWDDDFHGFRDDDSDFPLELERDEDDEEDSHDNTDQDPDSDSDENDDGLSATGAVCKNLEEQFATRLRRRAWAFRGKKAGPGDEKRLKILKIDAPLRKLAGMAKAQGATGLCLRSLVYAGARIREGRAPAEWGGARPRAGRRKSRPPRPPKFDLFGRRVRKDNLPRAMRAKRPRPVAGPRKPRVRPVCEGQTMFAGWGVQS